jgi:hypothetical protein
MMDAKFRETKFPRSFQNFREIPKTYVEISVKIRLTPILVLNIQHRSPKMLVGLNFFRLTNICKMFQLQRHQNVGKRLIESGTDKKMLSECKMKLQA